MWKWNTMWKCEDVEMWRYGSAVMGKCGVGK